MQAIATFRTYSPMEIMEFDFDQDSQAKTTVIDNILSELIAGKAELVDLTEFNYEIDNLDDQLDDASPVHALMFEIVMDVPENLTVDYLNKAVEITQLAIGELEKKDLIITHQWQRGEEQHVGFMANVA